MRPTIAEQLSETRRILTDVLTPRIKDDYALQIMRMAFSNLEMLEGAWPKVLPFLHWDNQVTLTLLGDVRGQVDADLASAVEQAEQIVSIDPFDVSTLETRNAELRMLLHRAIGQCSQQERRVIQAHLLERTARYPMRPLKASSTGTQEKKGD